MRGHGKIWAEKPLFPDPIYSCLSFPNLQGRVREGKLDEVIQDMYVLIAKPLYDDMVVRVSVLPVSPLL